MAYVEEKLTEQDKEFIAGFQFEDPLTVGLADIPSEWVADRERDYYLISLGGMLAFSILLYDRISSKLLSSHSAK